MSENGGSRVGLWVAVVVAGVASAAAVGLLVDRMHVVGERAAAPAATVAPTSQGKDDNAEMERLRRDLAAARREAKDARDEVARLRRASDSAKDEADRARKDADDAHAQAVSLSGELDEAKSKLPMPVVGVGEKSGDLRLVGQSHDTVCPGVMLDYCIRALCQVTNVGDDDHSGRVTVRMRRSTGSGRVRSEDFSLRAGQSGAIPVSFPEAEVGDDRDEILCQVQQLR
jgi:hypothetical protein